MNFLDFLKKKPAGPLNPKVLVCSVGDGFEAFASEDAAAYQRFLPQTSVLHFADAEALLSAASDHYDILDVFVDVNSDGLLGKSAHSGTELVEIATTAGTKLLWIANGNSPGGYIKNFKAKGKSINLVMTISRDGAKFPNFLHSLLGEMKYGATMPVAWNRLAPQIPGKEHTDAPTSIFFCGLGQARFI